MKTIFFLLFPVLLWGQFEPNLAKFEMDDWWTLDNPPSVVISDGETIEIVACENISITPGDSTITVHKDFYWRSKQELELLYLLELYERECYNDSTRAEIWDEEFIATDSIGDAVIGYTQLVGRVKWKHREPTFTGFIKWLKSRK